MAVEQLAVKPFRLLELSNSCLLDARRLFSLSRTLAKPEISATACSLPEPARDECKQLRASRYELFLPAASIEVCQCITSSACDYVGIALGETL